jgi:hypothetical protein
MAKRWTYSDASICTAGVMVCTACRKPIKEGAFRYLKNDATGYVTQHKACSLDDLEWKHIAKRQEEYAAYHERRKAALQAFVNEFGAPYEELIDECMAARHPVSTPLNPNQGELK